MGTPTLSESAHAVSQCDGIEQKNGSLSDPPEASEVVKPGIDYRFFITGLLGVFLAFVDDTFVFTTYGTIASQFGRGSMGSWLVTAYNLGFAVMLPLYGRLCDIYGYKIPIQAAYVLFSAGCLMSGLSNSMPLAIVGRFFSGAGGSGMTDLVVVIINDMEHPRKATELRSYISIVMTIAVPVGAPLGGAVTGWIGWRWAFIMQVPVGLGCLIMASWRLEVTKRAIPENGEETPSPADFNLPGIFLLGLSVAGVMTICQISGELNSKPSLKLPIVLSILFASVLLFGLNERCWTRAPLIPLKLIKTNGIGAMYLAQIILFFSYSGFCSHITEFWIRTKNYGDSLAAACILPVVFGNVISAFISSKFVQKVGTYKKLLIAGSVLSIINGVLLAGLGVGSILVCTFTGLSVSVPTHMKATAMTNYYLCQQLGMVAGVSVASVASRALFKQLLIQKIPQSRVKSMEIEHILNDLRYTFTLSGPTQAIVKQCFLQAFQVIPAISSGSLFLALLVFLRLPQRSLDQ